MSSQARPSAKPNGDLIQEPNGNVIQKKIRLTAALAVRSVVRVQSHA